jgi:hypothetical protein
MDISELVTQDNAEKGVWFRYVVGGKKYPFSICILGADSDKVLLYNKKKEKEAQKELGLMFRNVDESEQEIETANDIRERKLSDALVRIVGLRSEDKEPLTMQGVELKSDENSYRLICTKIPDIVDFVISKSNSRLNFLENRKKY